MNFIAVTAAMTATVLLTCYGYGKDTVMSNANEDNKPYSWYCKTNKQHLPPELPSEFSFIKEEEGYYLDTEVPEGERVIYLTFDVGYENGNVETILNVLKEHKAPAAFFVLGNLVIKNTALLTRMYDEGHLVCNHTSRHPDMSKKTSKEEFEGELARLNTLLYEYCGQQAAPFYRPPEGRFSRSNLRFARECGYKTVFWSYAYADWDNGKQMSREKALQKLKDHTHNGEVLLLHPTSSTNAAILDEYLCYLEAEGYSFGTLYALTENQG